MRKEITVNHTFKGTKEDEVFLLVPINIHGARVRYDPETVEKETQTEELETCEVQVVNHFQMEVVDYYEEEVQSYSQMEYLEVCETEVERFTQTDVLEYCEKEKEKHTQKKDLAYCKEKAQKQTQTEDLEYYKEEVESSTQTEDLEYHEVNPEEHCYSKKPVFDKGTMTKRQLKRREHFAEEEVQKSKKRKAEEEASKKRKEKSEGTGRSSISIKDTKEKREGTGRCSDIMKHAQEKRVVTGKSSDNMKHAQEKREGTGKSSDSMKHAQEKREGTRRSSINIKDAQLPVAVNCSENKEDFIKRLKTIYEELKMIFAEEKIAVEMKETMNEDIMPTLSPVQKEAVETKKTLENDISFNLCPVQKEKKGKIQVVQEHQEDQKINSFELDGNPGLIYEENFPRNNSLQDLQLSENVNDLCLDLSETTSEFMDVFLPELYIPYMDIDIMTPLNNESAILEEQLLPVNC
ncbi:hypothetical protein NPIL_433822 [Nephila pilipes]|uniref:Uncharacterized protein n=1 Tax=Nephila pilipes TaxID=299642 RepID=A0A8X6J5R0_NEPPI|nr:hypothetical protein NPIL_433822 [Nephila pilipes]